MPLNGPHRFTYRIEHRTDSEHRLLGTVQLVRPHPTVLDPYLSRLRLEGATGHLVLVSETSGRIGVQKSLEPPYSAAICRNADRSIPAVSDLNTEDLGLARGVGEETAGRD